MLLSSHRWRRRLTWAVALVGVAGAFLALNELLPSHGGPVRVSPAPGRPQAFTTSAAEQRAAAQAAAAVQPLANAFVDEVAHRRDVARAYDRLGPALRKRYSLADWQQGRNLPLSGVAPGTGGASLAFSGRTTVGYVAALPPAAAGTSQILFAVRFERTNGRWLVAYVHQGQASSYVSETNFAPSGFLPGSRHETRWTLLLLGLGLVLLVAVVALVDRRMSRSPA